jgi:ABC-type lipoprotein release transport system permease subunit
MESCFSEKIFHSFASALFALAGAIGVSFLLTVFSVSENIARSFAGCERTLIASFFLL